MKKQMHNPTMMIKSKFSNLVHKLVNPAYGVKRNSSEYWNAQRKQSQLTDKEKAEIFDKIMVAYKESSEELYNYFSDRGKKKRVNKERQARGWEGKKKKTA